MSIDPETIGTTGPEPPQNALPVQTLPGGVTTVTVPLPTDINLTLLKAQVQADPAIAGTGFWSFNPGVDPDGSPVLILGLTGNTAGVDVLARLNAVIAAHDPAARTPGQVKQAARDIARAGLAQFVVDTQAGKKKNAEEIQAALAALIVALGMDDERQTT